MLSTREIFFSFFGPLFPSMDQATFFLVVTPPAFDVHFDLLFSRFFLTWAPSFSRFGCF